MKPEMEVYNLINKIILDLEIMKISAIGGNWKFCLQQFIECNNRLYEVRNLIKPQIQIADDDDGK